MKPKVYDILMDVKKGLLNNEIIRVVTGDYGMNKFNLKLLQDRLVPYNLQNTIVRIMVVTPSGSKQQQDLIVENAMGGSANITLKQSLFSESGEYIAEFQIFDETTQVLRLTTPRFKYFAVESLQDDATITSSDEYSILQQMIEDVGDINNNINTKVDTHNNDVESHPSLVAQLKEIATDISKEATIIALESDGVYDRKGSYCKKNGWVSISFEVSKKDGGGHNRGEYLLTLPVGFRPKMVLELGAASYTPSGNPTPQIMGIKIYATGQVQVTTTATTKAAYSHMTFYAGGGTV